jgi:16S rRNA (cytidine1402-2'-O)-methyltransferase
MINKLDPALYIVATPIGNLSDITQRAIDTISTADIIACEDTRVTRKLLSLLGIKPVKLIACHDHNEEQSAKGIIELIKTEGKSVVLVSDAGTPVVSDPGYKLVKHALENDISVESIPGACSVINALVLSGLTSDSFYFGGFLPTKKQALENKLNEIKNLSATVIFFESANRLPKTIEVMSQILGARKTAVMREMTKKFEETKRARLPELHEYYKENGSPKGEVVIAIAPPDKDMPESNACNQINDKQIDEMLEEALKTMSVKAASNYVREELAKQSSKFANMSRKEIYNKALHIKDTNKGKY